MIIHHHQYYRDRQTRSAKQAQAAAVVALRERAIAKRIEELQAAREAAATLAATS